MNPLLFLGLASTAVAAAAAIQSSKNDDKIEDLSKKTTDSDKIIADKVAGLDDQIKNLEQSITNSAGTNASANSIILSKIAELTEAISKIKEATPVVPDKTGEGEGDPEETPGQ